MVVLVKQVLFWPLRVGVLSHGQDCQVSVGCKEVEYEDYWKKTRLREPLLSARDQK